MQRAHSARGNQLEKETLTVATAKNVGLLLTLGGAPEVPHTVVGVRGQYRPDRPTPIGGPGELTITEAEAAIENGAPLEIVEISKTKLDALRAAAAAELQQARQGAVAARQDKPEGAEPGQIADHLNALKAG